MDSPCKNTEEPQREKEGQPTQHRPLSKPWQEEVLKCNLKGRLDGWDRHPP